MNNETALVGRPRTGDRLVRCADRYCWIVRWIQNHGPTSALDRTFVSAFIEYTEASFRVRASGSKACRPLERDLRTLTRSDALKRHRRGILVGPGCVGGQRWEWVYELGEKAAQYLSAPTTQVRYLGNSKRHDLSGMRFGRLTAVRPGEDAPNGKPRWVCKCDCGTLTLSPAANLKNGCTQSCGCINRERLHNQSTHGMTGAPEYTVWRSMMGRCYNAKARHYKDYGGRGIAVCDQWRRSFVEFMLHVGIRPSPHHSLDRINNNRGYEPGNVRWATHKQQQNNRRNTRRFDYKGEHLTIRELSAVCGIKYQTLYSRLNRDGWAINDATTVPPTRRTSKTEQ
jgi:hypothetical protein